MEQEVLSIVKKQGANASALISILQEIQDRYNYLPRTALIILGEMLNLPLTKIYEVATFYNAFSLNPQGKYLIEVCAGTACHVKGAANLINTLERDLKVKCGETTEDTFFTLKQVRCLGCCSLAPVVRINGKIYANQDQASLPEIVRKYR